MPASLRARFLATCQHLEIEARSKERNGKLVAHGIRRAIVAIQPVPAVEGTLLYLAMLKVAVEKERAQVESTYTSNIASILKGLEIVLKEIEDEAAQFDYAAGTKSDSLIPGLPIHVSLATEVDIRLWCVRLNCNEAQLLDAVANAGTAVERVRSYLKRATLKR